MKMLKKFLFLLIVALTVALVTPNQLEVEVSNTVSLSSDLVLQSNGLDLTGMIPDVQNVVQDIAEIVLEWVEAFWGLIITSINLAIGLLYDPAGLTLATRITFIGYLALLGMAVGIVKLGMSFVMKFFKKG